MRTEPATGLGRRLAGLTTAAIVAAALALVLPTLAAAGTGANGPATANSIFKTTREYVIHFYPRWFTYGQSRIAPETGLTMPRQITPLYHLVVAVNDDTFYAAGFVNLSKEPAVLTIPPTRSTYSLLTLDGFGDVFETAIEKQTPGTYALVGPEWKGTLPAGVTPISVPYDSSQWIIRADKHSSNGAGPALARKFVRQLHLTSLSEWEKSSLAGPTNVVPELFYSIPFKGAADREARLAPIGFLEQLQEAVRSPTTQPLSQADQQLSERFDSYFGIGGSKAGAAKRAFSDAVRAAHAAIIANYRTHEIGRNWISFTNIGEWGTAYLDRSSIAEYILYGNNFGAAAYFQTFEDSRGRSLNGKRHRVYVLRFSRKQIPEAQRFWSLTAYLPGSVELVPNSADKYVVASYTPGLKKNRDGSITIYMSAKRPPDAPVANWLPVPDGKFNVMLRDYGPKGSVADGEYVPPAVELRR